MPDDVSWVLQAIEREADKRATERAFKDLSLNAQLFGVSFGVWRAVRLGFEAKYHVQLEKLSAVEVREIFEQRKP